MSISTPERVKELLKASGLSQSKAADMISLKLGITYSERDLRAWQAESGTKNSRPCPANVMALFEAQFGDSKKAA